MNLTNIEKKILQQLATNGAATVHELTEAIACSLSGVQSAMRTLRAADLIRQGDLKHVPGMYKRARMYLTNTTHAAVGENPLPARMAELEERFKNLTETHNRMVLKYSEYATSVSRFGGKTEQLDRWFGDHEVWLTSLDNRIRALEPASAPVDPIYAEIEEWVRTTLGGKDVPEEALRNIIDEVYAKRTN